MLLLIWGGRLRGGADELLLLPAQMHAPHKTHDVGASSAVDGHSDSDTTMKHTAAKHGAKLTRGGVAGVLTLKRATDKWRGHKKSKTVVESKALNADEIAIMTGTRPVACVLAQGPHYACLTACVRVSPCAGVIRMRQLTVADDMVITPVDDCFMLSLDDKVIMPTDERCMCVPLAHTYNVVPCASAMLNCRTAGLGNHAPSGDEHPQPCARVLRQRPHPNRRLLAGQVAYHAQPR